MFRTNVVRNVETFLYLLTYVIMRHDFSILELTVTGAVFEGIS